MTLGAIAYIAGVGLVLGLVLWRVARAHSRLTGEGAEGRRFSEWGHYPSDSSSHGSHDDAGGHH